MRKRQWKKILSVVLALAMVFSMNVSAFADEVTDPVAVEEPAAEQPVAEAPTEEPAPAAEEPEETPAPVEEEAPAKGEEAAGWGTAPDGWYASGGSTSDWSETTTLNVVDGETVTLASAEPASDREAIKIVVGTGSALNITETASGDFDDFVLVDSSQAISSVPGSIGVAGNYWIVPLVDDNTNYEFGRNEDDTTTYKKFSGDLSTGVAVYTGSFENVTSLTPVTLGAGPVVIGASAGTDTVVAGTTAKTLFVVATSDPTDVKMYTIPGIPAKPETLTDGDISAKDNTSITVDKDNSDYEFQADGADTANPITGLTRNTTYSITYRVKAVSGTASDAAYASPWSDGFDVTTTDVEPPAEDTFTVSGYKFILDGSTVSAGSTSDNAGIYTIKLGLGEGKTSGKVKVQGPGPMKALSVDVAEGVTLEFDKTTDKITDYSKMSVFGKGTILVNPVADSSVFTKAFEKVDAGVLISGNEANILLSANDAGTPKYETVMKDFEAAYKAEKAVKVVPVAIAWGAPKYDDYDPYFPLAYDNGLLNTVRYSASHYDMLSENAPYFTTLTDPGAIVVSGDRIEDVSVKYNTRVILFNENAKDSLAGAFVIDVAPQGVYKWETSKINGMETSEGIDVDIYDGTSGKENYSQYEFTVSTNGGAAGKKSAEESGEWYTYGSVTWDTNGNSLEPNTQYYLFARRLPTEDEYKSEVTEVFPFKTLNKVSISINLTNASLSPNFIGDDGIGDDDLKKLADNTNVINRKFFDFKLTGFKEGTHVVDGFDDDDRWNDNKYTVVDADGFKVGIIEVKYAEYSATKSTMESNFASADKKFYQLGVNTGAKYAAELSFTSDGKGSNPPSTVYNNISSSYSVYNNLVSFNVIKAPVKYEPKNIPVVAVSGQIADSVISSFGYKATNTITGLPATTGGYSGAVSFLIDGKLANSASWNKLAPGTYAVKVSQNTLANDDYATVDGKGADYSTTAPLKIVDPNGAEALKVSGKFIKDVYYGEPIEAVKKSVSASFTFGGVDVTGGSALSHWNDVVILEAPSSNIAAAKKVDETKTVSANTKLYAYIYNVNHTVAGKSLGPVSSDAIEFTILPRPVDVRQKDDKPITSYRGDKATASVNKADLKVIAITNGAKYPYDGEALDAEKFFADKFINLDTSVVNTNKPGTYKTAITGYTLSTNYAQNYVVKPADEKLDYKVLGKWYVKYILEYGGRGAATGKRYVSSDEVIVEAEDGSKNKIGDKYEFTPQKKITVSWNLKDGSSVLPEGDTIVKWEVKRADTLENVGLWDGMGAYDTDLNPMDYKATAGVRLSDYDFAVYAVVAAQATKEGVMVESISPVIYNGMAHVTADEGSNTKSNDLGSLVIYDEKKIDATDVDTINNYLNKDYTWDRTEGTKEVYTKYLVQGVDYTVSYKNNKNASVAYDRTVSGDDGSDGIDPTFKRIVTDKKMPQVVIKGKGDFKSLKTTVLFDIIPADYKHKVGGEWYGEWEVASAPAKYQLAGKTLNKKATLADWITTKWSPYKEKQYKLKEGKANSKKLSGYTGDYTLEIFKQADNGTRTKVTNLKNIAAGDYKFVYTGVNNYTGSTEENVYVRTGELFSKQTIKYAKKQNWKKGIKASSFITKVTTKKRPKTEIPFVGADGHTKAGYVINEVDSLTGGRVVDDGKGDYDILDAGKYVITFSASGKLAEEKSIYGTHQITVEVKGTKVKPADFKIDGKKASKTVIVDYNGEANIVPVTSKWQSDEDSKVPTTLPTTKVQESNPDDALTEAGYDNGYYDDTVTILGDNSYLDSGVDFAATQTGRGVYAIAPYADNASLFSNYYIYIKPTGKYTAGTSTGYVVLSYKRGGLDLSKVVNKKDIFKVTAKDVPVNVGGTPAELIFNIAGMNDKDAMKGNDNYSTTVSGDLTNYNINSKKSRVLYNGYDILEITYAKNKKVGTATATIKPAGKYGKQYFKKSAKVTYNIKTNEVKKVREFDAEGGMEDGEVFAIITDAAKAEKMSCVLYQMDACGGKYVKLGKKDYKAALGKEDAKKGYTVAITDGTSTNFKFAKDTLVKNAKETDNAYFNVYGKKAKRIVATLSDGKAYGFVQKKKGVNEYVYSGKEINPTVTSLVVDGTTYYSGEGKSTSNNFIVTYNNNLKVGTATATITLKRDTETAGLSGNAAYPAGGTVVVKYKIVPHTNNKLILSE